MQVAQNRNGKVGIGIHAQPALGDATLCAAQPGSSWSPKSTHCANRQQQEDSTFHISLSSISRQCCLFLSGFRENMEYRLNKMKL
jgi:hypothetical protein